MTESIIEQIAKKLNPQAFSEAPSDSNYYACKPKGQSREVSNAEWRHHNRVARAVARSQARLASDTIRDLGPKEIKDAARWRALIAAGRIRCLGSAGFDRLPETQTISERLGAKARPEGTLHFGMEVWSTYGDTSDPDLQQGIQKENCHGRSILTAYVDEIIRRARA